MTGGTDTPAWWRAMRWWRVRFICTGTTDAPHPRTALGAVSILGTTEHAGLILPDFGTTAAPVKRPLLDVWPPASGLWPDGVFQDESPDRFVEFVRRFADERTYTFKCFRCTGRRRRGERTWSVKESAMAELLHRMQDTREQVFDIGQV